MQLQTLICKLLQHFIAECDPHYNSERERGWLAFIAISVNLLCELFSAELIILSTVLSHISLVLVIINNKLDLENVSGAGSSITHCHDGYGVYKSSVAQYLKCVKFWKEKNSRGVLWQSVTINDKQQWHVFQIEWWTSTSGSYIQLANQIGSGVFHPAHAIYTEQPQY